MGLSNNGSSLEFHSNSLGSVPGSPKEVNMSRTIRHKSPWTFDKDDPKISRDGKDGSPTSAFKKFTKKGRKAKERDAMRHLDEEAEIPKFKREDKYLWW